MRFSTMRGIVAFVVIIVLSVAALALGTGTGTLSALGVGQLAALCPVGALESWLGARSVGLHGVICLGVTVAIVVVVGKALCAWACPVPWLQRFFRPKGRKGVPAGEVTEETCASGPEGTAAVDARESMGEGTGADAALDAAIAAELGAAHGCAGARGAQGAACGACALGAVGGKRDGLQIDTRHVVLGGALISSLVAGFPVFCLVCPVGLSFATLYGVWHLLQFNETTWGLLVFPLLLVLEVVVLRRWCAKICPISALLGLVARLNVTFRPRVDAQRCLRSQGVDCRVCISVCPEQLDPHAHAIPECSKCGACVEACPAQAVRIKALPTRRDRG